MSYTWCVIVTYVQAMSPDGEAIVTGAGDETLRFWNVFSKMRSTKVMILPITDCSLNAEYFSPLLSVYEYVHV